MGFSASVSIVRPGVVRARKILAPGMSWVIAAVFALADLARGSLASPHAFLLSGWRGGGRAARHSLPTARRAAQHRVCYDPPQ